MEVKERAYKALFEALSKNDTQNVFTPPRLIRRMLNRIDFTSNSKVLVWYNVEFLTYLVKEVGLSPKNIYIYTNTVDKLILEKQGYNVVYHESIDFDKITSEFKKMKFDVIVGNPPYQGNTDNVGAGHTLWDKFISMSLNNILKKGGHTVLVHPSGWRNISGSFDEVKNVINSMDLLYLEIHNIEDGLQTFGAATRYDICVVRNTYTKNLQTTIVDEDRVKSEVNVKNLDFIPNNDIVLLKKIISNDESDKVELCFSHSKYDPRKSWMSNELTETNYLPCVKYISKVDNSIDFRYSSQDKGMFGKPKVMFGIGSQVGGIVPDYNGEYGLCQFVAGIVDKVENLDNITKALKSKKFRKIMKACQFTTQMYNYKIIQNLKKDFWREFIDE